MTDVELLPMPEEEWNVRYGYYADAMREYARANVAHATAAKDAEIEALRAEVETWKNFARGNKGLLQESVYRAERLAETLREAYGQVRELCDAHVHPYPEASFARYEAALLPTAIQDGK